jgi:phosphomannomutase
MVVTVNPIKFGTDGWRGLIAADFTFERVILIASLAAKVLAENYKDQDNLIVVGYDRRFMAEEFALAAAEAVAVKGFEVKLAQTYSSTPTLSWAAKDQNALGAIVLTASHNPAGYLGLKVKGAFGGSVPPEITQQIETLIPDATTPPPFKGEIERFDPWASYVQELRSKVDLAKIQSAIQSGKITVLADVMHGSAAGGLSRILDLPIAEINSDRDPLFGGHPPEPLPRHLSQLFRQIRTEARKPESKLRVGFVFDGDGDRIAAVDGAGNFLSSQILIPILIEHFAKRRGFTGEVVKTVSGSDIIPRVAELYNLPIHQTPIGYKYIADRMLSHEVLIGGEESGGIGFGTNIPERDGLLSALYLLEAMVESGKDLSELYTNLQSATGFTSAYDRIDLPLASMSVRQKLLDRLQSEPMPEIAGKQVVDVLSLDGYKFRLEDDSWLLIRFSGTEPVLRLYCEAADLKQVSQTLAWAKDWAKS